jgi:hypothetical protein
VRAYCRFTTLESGDDPGMSTPDERRARNEALFRAVNERIESLSRPFDSMQETLTIVCECGDGECTQPLHVRLAAYERVRADPLLFLIAPGHAIPEIEGVVERDRAYEVVRKRNGVPAEIAEQTDPRG